MRSLDTFLSWVNIYAAPCTYSFQLTIHYCEKLIFYIIIYNSLGNNLHSYLFIIDSPHFKERLSVHNYIFYQTSSHLFVFSGTNTFFPAKYRQPARISVIVHRFRQYGIEHLLLDAAHEVRYSAA